jgi:hypothetical protein
LIFPTEADWQDLSIAAAITETLTTNHKKRTFDVRLTPNSGRLGQGAGCLRLTQTGHRRSRWISISTSWCEDSRRSKTASASIIFDTSVATTGALRYWSPINFPGRQRCVFPPAAGIDIITSSPHRS